MINMSPVVYWLSYIPLCSVLDIVTPQVASVCAVLGLPRSSVFPDEGISEDSGWEDYSLKNFTWGPEI